MLVRKQTFHNQKYSFCFSQKLQYFSLDFPKILFFKSRDRKTNKTLTVQHSSFSRLNKKTTVLMINYTSIYYSILYYSLWSQLLKFEAIYIIVK